MAEGIAPKCDFCSERAVYDAKTKFGPWGYMCEKHFELLGDHTPGMYKHLEEVGKRKCRICGKMKPISDFYTYVDHNGITRMRTECKECNLKCRKSKGGENDE